MKESDIIHENDVAFVFRDMRKSQYTVFRSKLTHSESDSAYPMNPDGLSTAKARADYLCRKIKGEA